jgi:hypothetical protein
MRLAIMQPYVFPYIGYYQLISAVDKFVIYDDVNFINRGWINRNNLLVNGKAALFSIPLKNASQNRLINEISLMDDPGWRTKFLKTAELAYKKAPHFNEIFPLLNDVMTSGSETISELAYRSIRSVCDYLSIDTVFVESSVVYGNSNLKAQYRILDICKKEQASHYINPIGGVEIYDRALFENDGIKIDFIKTDAVNYKQFLDAFVPNLSIIDVLMFNPAAKLRELLTQYELV